MDSCGTPSLMRGNLLPFVITGGKGKAAIVNQVHKHADYCMCLSGSIVVACRRGRDAIQCRRLL